MIHPIRSLSKRLAKLRRFPTVLDRRGSTFVLDPQNWIDNRLIAGVPFENQQIERAKGLIAELGIDIFVDIFVDIGANIGLYTVLLGKLPEITRVFAFEPVRRNHNQLCGNIFANRLDAKVDVHRVAASDREGTAVIHIDPTSTGVARLDLQTAARDIRVYRESETVRLARIDELLALQGRRIYLKIDVEGHALPALVGMQRLLADNEVTIQAELADADRETVIEALRDCGYTLIEEILGDGFFTRSPDNGSN
jgi:FkbM family methyltransferase